MQIQHLDTLTPSTIRAGLVLSFAEPLEPAVYNRVRDRLERAGVLEEVEGSRAEPDDGPTAFVVGIWLPRSATEIEAAQGVLAELAAEHGAKGAWLMAVTTSIDLSAEVEDDELEVGKWQQGPPPQATRTPFPLEGYPDILEDFDWEDFGVALKLGGEARPGEAQALALIHHLWMSHYVDVRADAVPFRHAQLSYDATRRSALLWVDRFAAPASVPEMVHHLMAVASSVNEVIPVIHGRFDVASMELKYGGMMDEPPPVFVLAGNPLRAAFESGGLEAAATWAENQREWSPEELAAMYVELGCDFDPDEPDEAALAIGLFDRAAAHDASNDDAKTYAQVALVRSGSVDQAIARARATEAPTVFRALTVNLVGDHAPDRFGDAVALLDAAVLDDTGEELMGEIVAQVIRLAPAELDRVLAAVPREPRVIPYLEQAAYGLEDKTLSLKLYDTVAKMPIPSVEENQTARRSYLQCLNAAIVTAQGVQDLERARGYSDFAVPHATENPYIFHSAACIYALLGDTDKALEMAEGAFVHDYDHLERMIDDDDLSSIRDTAKWKALVEGYRARMAKVEPIGDVGEDGFTSAVLECDRPVLVDFTASWCGPCKRQAPILEKLATRAGGRFKIVKVDIDDNPGLAERYEATSVPTLVFFRGGEEVGRTVGLSDIDELTALIEDA